MRYFSLFTGVGGLDMGLEEIGAKCVGFSEIKKSSIEIYLKHYPLHEPFGDIKLIDPEALPDFDVLTGGFPCQAFSMAGLRKGMNDPKGVLILYIYNILIAKRPKFAVLENVKGLLSHDKGRTYIKVHQLLQSAGYYVRVVLINSMHHGSAQSRERLIFLCSTEPFERKELQEVDSNVRFKDIREPQADYRQDLMVDLQNERLRKKIFQEHQFKMELIGDYDRVGTITTQKGGGEKVVGVNDSFRYLSPLECERLQNFPDGWTDYVAESNRYFALGNAVNCNVSRYLFKDYLKGLWY